MPMLSPTQFRNLDLQNNLVILTSIVQQPQDKKKLVEICVAPYCVKKKLPGSSVLLCPGGTCVTF